MSSSSPKTISPAGWPTDARPRTDARLKRHIGWARFVLAVERVMPSLWPAIGILGLFFALALFGLFAVIPWIVQSLLLAAAITATGLALEDGFRNFRWPDWQDAARRLERDNRLAHRPISEGDEDTTQPLEVEHRVEFQLLQTQRHLQEYDLAYEKWSFLPSLTLSGAYNLNYQSGTGSHGPPHLGEARILQRVQEFWERKMRQMA